MDAKKEGKASRMPSERDRTALESGSLTLELMTLDIEHEI